MAGSEVEQTAFVEQLAELLVVAVVVQQVAFVEQQLVELPEAAELGVEQQAFVEQQLVD